MAQVIAGLDSAAVMPPCSLQQEQTSRSVARTAPSDAGEGSRFAVFDCCPQCDGPMAAEHAHFRCRQCGWRDSCCD